MATGKQRRQMKAWIKAHTRKGSKCSECGVTFTVDRGDGKRVAIFPNGHGFSAFVLCFKCGQTYERGGPAALPEVMKDAKLAIFLSPVATPTATSFVQ
jgi:hypothetical protein